MTIFHNIYHSYCKPHPNITKNLMPTQNQYQLLASRRFLPLFITQFLGAFNDNVFKNALLIWIAYQVTTPGNWSVHTLTNLSSALFIVPFFLFSATIGQLADKYEKSQQIRRIKLLEVILMVCTAYAFYIQDLMMLIILLFFMGAQSTLFGPIKYGILPQHLEKSELIGGNGLIAMGTFLAILSGTALGGVLISANNMILLGMILIGIALAGWIASYFIPPAPALAPDLRINWNPITESWAIFKLLRNYRTVGLSALGISWFYFYGFTYLTQLPSYTKTILGADKEVVTLLLTLFSIGIGVGSLLCERLSGRTVELGLVPFGAFGLSVFAFGLFIASPQSTTLEKAPLFSLAAFLAQPGNLSILANIVLIGLFAGFYVVPLQALIQSRSDPAERSRLIAGNNILNAFWMVMAAAFSALILNAGYSVAELFLLVGLLNLAVAYYIFTLVPEFLMRFIVWGLVHTIYRVNKQGLHHIPEQGAAVLICNHVSFVDALIIAGCVRRPVRFVMDHAIFKMPVLNFVFRTAKAIPIASAHEDKEQLKQAYDAIAEALSQGELVCIFPEGQITRTGELNKFRGGISRIIRTTPVPVIPMALNGLWGSFFSRQRGVAMRHFPRRFWSKIRLDAGAPVPPEKANPAYLQQQVEAMLRT